MRRRDPLSRFWRSTTPTQYAWNCCRCCGSIRVRLITCALSSGRRLLGDRFVARGRVSAFTIAVFGILVAAATLRIYAYAINPSLSTDEAQLALNITGRPLGQLFSQLDFNQGAPPIYLAASDGAVWLFGDTERSLRVLPFLAAVLATPLFWCLARDVLDSTGSIIALVVFAASSPLMEFAITSKPYSTDVLVGLTLYLLGMRALRSHRRGDIIAFAAVGAVAVWLSYPAIFFLTGISVVLTVVLGRDSRARFALLGATAGWALIFAASYSLARSVLHNLELGLAQASTRPAGAGGTIPALEASLRSAAGAFRYLLGIGNVYVGGLDLGDVAALAALAAFAVGFVLLAREAPAQTALVAAPLAVAAGAIVVGRYPLYPRTLLFVVPALVLFAVRGIIAIRPRQISILAAPFVAVLAVGVALLVAPGVKSALEPSHGDGVRPAMDYLAKHQKTRDGVYLYYSLQYSFRYYAECECFADDAETGRSSLLWPAQPTVGPGQWDAALRSTSGRFVVGRRYGENAEDQLPDLARVPGRNRVWILIGNVSEPERNELLRCLSSLGKLKMAVPAPTPDRAAHLYLYDFLARRTSSENVHTLCPPR
jgi:4-amino-4-deoxy-L-arabinose transferase-like glycosyltransferase